jgi:exopolysaccharide biosynthesis polyprenyl glycosylphosphotransferase
VKRADVIFNVLRVPVDFVLLVGAGLFVYVLRTQVLDVWRPVLFGPDLPLNRYGGLVLAVSGLFVASYAISGLYAMKLRMTRLQEAARVVVASSAAIMAVIVVIFLRQELFNSRFLIVGYWAVATVTLVVGRLCLRWAYRRIMSHTGAGAHRVLLVGDDYVADLLERTIAADPGMGYRVVKRLANPHLEAVIAAVGNPGVDEIILANPDHPADEVIRLVDFCHDRHILFTFVPNIHKTLTTHWDVDAIGRTPVVQLRRTSLDGWGRVFKRMFDAVVSLLALVGLVPIFFLIAFAIKWETAGPVFVRLRRMSRNREIGMYKFRSMIENAEDLKALLIAQNERGDGPLFKMRDDPRITRVGKVLRQWRLDELPQFWNILKGDISLVGPRPHQPDEIARYEKHHRKVLAIKAGATGFAQVSGSSDLPFEEEVALDTFYIENWSLWLDVKIILKTALKMVNDRSAV